MDTPKLVFYEHSFEDPIKTSLAKSVLNLGIECRALADKNARLKTEVEQLKEGNDCLGQMHDKEMERSAYLLEEFNRTTAWGRGLESDLSHARVEISFLKAEVERLRKAGDAMQKRLYVLENPTHHEVYLKLLSDWNAAKEGKPSV